MDDREAAAVAKALSHPLRLAILREVRDRRSLSPAGYARETGEPLGNVSYHVAVLREAGVLEVTDTARRRGALEHFHSLTGPRAGIALGVMDLLGTA
jgi:DNA-binding transcriptional ArsR family regulator